MGTSSDRLLGKPRGWYTYLWAHLLFGVAGTAGQALGYRAGYWSMLFIRYGVRRTLDEHLHVVSWRPTIVSNGDNLGRQQTEGIVFLLAFLASAVLLLFLLRAALPAADGWRDLPPANERRPEDYDGATLMIFLVATLSMFFTMSLVPKLIVGTATLVAAWLVDCRFRRLAAAPDRGGA